MAIRRIASFMKSFVVFSIKHSKTIPTNTAAPVQEGLENGSGDAVEEAAAAAPVAPEAAAPESEG